MTVANLVHPMRGYAGDSQALRLLLWRHRVMRRFYRDLALWRAVGIGFAFALLAGAMMAMALGEAGTAPVTHQAVAIHTTAQPGAQIGWAGP